MSEQLGSTTLTFTQDTIILSDCCLGLHVCSHDGGKTWQAFIPGTDICLGDADAVHPGLPEALQTWVMHTLQSANSI